MKKIIYFLAAIVLLASCSMNKSAVQSSNFEQAMNQISESVIKDSKERAKKTAKQLKRKGYYVDPMGLPMDIQLEKAILFEGIVDNSGNTRYIVEKARVVSKTPGTGKQHATELAKITIAGYLQSHIVGLVQTDLTNQQLSLSEAEAINKSISVYENWIAQNLGSVIPVAVLYKDHKDHIEVFVNIAYDKGNVDELVSNKIVSKLAEDTNVAREKLEKVFHSDRFQNISSGTNNLLQ